MTALNEIAERSQARTTPEPEDYERKGLAMMDDQQAEQSFHRWKAWQKRMSEARK